MKLFKTHTIREMSKQLLLTSALLSALDTMPAFLIRDRVSIELSHIRTMCAINNAINDVVKITINSYFLQKNQIVDEKPHSHSNINNHKNSLKIIFLF